MQDPDSEAPMLSPLLPNSTESPLGPENPLPDAEAYGNIRSGHPAASTELTQAWEVLHEVVLPVTILLLGVGFSVAALYVAMLPLLAS